MAQALLNNSLVEVSVEEVTDLELQSYRIAFEEMHLPYSYPHVSPLLSFRGDVSAIQTGILEIASGSVVKTDDGSTVTVLEVVSPGIAIVQSEDGSQIRIPQSKLTPSDGISEGRKIEGAAAGQVFKLITKGITMSRRLNKAGSGSSDLDGIKSDVAKYLKTAADLNASLLSGDGKMSVSEFESAFASASKALSDLKIRADAALQASGKDPTPPLSDTEGSAIVPIQSLSNGHGKSSDKKDEDSEKLPNAIPSAQSQEPSDSPDVTSISPSSAHSSLKPGSEVTFEGSDYTVIAVNSNDGVATIKSGDRQIEVQIDSLQSKE